MKYISRFLSRKIFFSHHGFLFFEAIILIGLSSTVLITVLGTIAYLHTLQRKVVDEVNGSWYAREALDALVNIRQREYDSLLPGTYRLMVTDGQWDLESGAPEIIDNLFERSITVSDIVPDQKQVVVLVTWPVQLPLAERFEVRFTTELYNWLPVNYDWFNPLECGGFDLTAENSGSNNHDSRLAYVENGYLYIGNANSNGKEVLIFNITQAPTLTMVGYIDTNDTPTDFRVRDSLLYVLSRDNNEELRVYDVSNFNNIQLVSTLNFTIDNTGDDNSDPIAMDMLGNYLYVVRDGGYDFIVVDISNPVSPLVAGVSSVSGIPRDIVVSDKSEYGAYAYVATTDNVQEIQVFDISYPELPFLSSTVNLNDGNQNADALAVAVNSDGNRLYVGRDLSSPQNRILYVFDIGGQGGYPLPLSSGVAPSSQRVKHISLDNASGLAFTLSSNILYVWSINSPSPSIISSVNIDAILNQSDGSESFNRIFIAGRGNPEVRVICPDLVF